MKLKIRGWDHREKKMDFPDNVANDIDLGKYNLMMWTGLKDKNGKEIYEGDIVYCHNTKKKDVVKFEEFEGYEGALAIGYVFNTAYKDKLEVIGNIYENKDMLNPLDRWTGSVPLRSTISGISNTKKRPSHWSKTDRKFIKYILKCSKNITDSEKMREDFGLIPPMLQLFKMTQEITNYLKDNHSNPEEGGKPA